ncbi:MAG: response regulator [Chloroflexi bacterium]|nr:response regulator [Chloroflexota bacterium]MCC6891774.1 response regulator [Anaerolineae bacterium]
MSKILVAEDNPNARQLVHDILESLGYESVLAVDGPSAVAAAQSQVPDLIILDVNMPGMSGFEVCRIIKSDVKLAHIPVLMLTAQSDVESRVTGLGLGADDYIGKPFSPRELAARVEARIRAKSENDNLRRTQEIIRQTFERYVSPNVVEKLLESPSDVQLGGKLQEITVLFSDLEGFTSVSEKTDPQKLLGILNLYHELVVGIIQSEGGTVDKFIGDGVMSLYNTPLAQPDHALRAIRTALNIRRELVNFSQQFEPIYRMKINFGINTGTAVVGNVGTNRIMNFTAVGDTVNLASRLQALSNNEKILLSQATYDQLNGQVHVNPLGARSVKGRIEPVMVYEALELVS